MIDNANDHLCIWQCLVISDRIRHNQARPAENTIRDALDLAHKFYGNPNLRIHDVRLTKLIDFESITLRFWLNVRLYKPEAGNANEAWKLDFGQVQHRRSHPCVDVSLFEGHCFYI